MEKREEGKDRENVKERQKGEEIKWRRERREMRENVKERQKGEER